MYLDNSLSDHDLTIKILRLANASMERGDAPYQNSTPFAQRLQREGLLVSVPRKASFTHKYRITKAGQEKLGVPVTVDRNGKVIAGGKPKLHMGRVVR